MKIDTRCTQDKIKMLREQQIEIAKHPKLTSLNQLYNEAIKVQEDIWLGEMGVIKKSRGDNVDFKPLIDAMAEELQKNDLDLKELEGCKDCEIKTLRIRRNKLGQFVRED